MVSKCESLKETIVKYLIERTAADASGDLCVVTVPVRTVDGRLVDVFVESRIGDLYSVHDAGKAGNEIIFHGIDLTGSANRTCEKVASALGVQWSEDTFRVDCKADKLASAVFAVASASALSSIHLLESITVEEEDTMRDQLAPLVKNWGRSVRAKIEEGVPAQGEWKQHKFDFVAYPKKSATPVAITVINPGGSAIAAAERYGFKVKDLQSTEFAKWKRVAVRSKAETWSNNACALVARSSDAVISIDSGLPPTPTSIQATLNRVLEQAS